MRTAYRKHRRIVGLSLMVGMALLLFCLAKQRQQGNERPYGRYTRTQIIQMSEPICRQITNEEAVWQWMAEPLSNPQGIWWAVTCQNAAGEPIVQLNWNAETGEVGSIGREYPHQRQTNLRLSRQDADSISRYWMQVLPLNYKSTSWHQTRLSIHSVDRAAVWVSEFSTAGRQVKIGLQGYSGDLYYVIVSVKPAASEEKFSLKERLLN